MLITINWRPKKWYFTPFSFQEGPKTVLNYQYLKCLLQNRNKGILKNNTLNNTCLFDQEIRDFINAHILFLIQNYCIFCSWHIIIQAQKERYILEIHSPMLHLMDTLLNCVLHFLLQSCLDLWMQLLVCGWMGHDLEKWKIRCTCMCTALQISVLHLQCPNIRVWDKKEEKFYHYFLAHTYGR